MIINYSNQFYYLHLMFRKFIAAAFLLVIAAAQCGANCQDCANTTCNTCSPGYFIQNITCESCPNSCITCSTQT